ncbi:hypothetical protein [Lentzea sp. HUAS12]|uniref:hypothetical protein n=1 Tax=Lentzea sp. HUAS12 TaxID=2951806 RepID=UPI00209FE62F|nr:hypothetical protein [Lentzea sp. HUAS12]USX49966.1 hypothetical protein ND450_31845 [Lentzea sp. HUAS12]
MGSADASPVLRELVSRFADDPARVDAWTDSELYAEIALAASVVAGGSPPGTWSDAAAARIGERMGAGWFADVSLTSPQLHHGPLPVVRVTNGEPRSVVGQKPQGALWTSSRLPDGSTGWSLFDHDREPVEVVFDPEEVRVHHLDDVGDYTRLVARYPRTAAGTAHVDWEAAAAELDAVHLTARGLLRIEGLVVDTPAGPACLTGWNAECTAWLRAPG